MNNSEKMYEFGMMLIALNLDDFKCIASGGKLTINTPLGKIMLALNLEDFQLDKMEKIILALKDKSLPWFNHLER